MSSTLAARDVKGICLLYELIALALQSCRSNGKEMEAVRGHTASRVKNSCTTITKSNERTYMRH